MGSPYQKKADIPFAVQKKTLHFDFMLGKFNTSTFYKEMIKECPEITPETFIESWTTPLLPHNTNVSLAKVLSNYVPIFVLSVTDELHASYQYNKFGLDQFVTSSVFSYEYGYLKPAKELFRIAIEQFGYPAEEYLFIDDRIQNVEAAKRLGIKSIQYRETETLSLLVDKLKKAQNIYSQN